MFDLSETRLRLMLWLHQSCPFRFIAWIRSRGVPQERGFGKFSGGGETVDEVVNRQRAEITKRETEHK